MPGPVPQPVQDALDKLITDYGTLQTDTGVQTEKYNTLAVAEAEATASDQAVANDHVVVSGDLTTLQQAIAAAFPN